MGQPWRCPRTSGAVGVDRHEAVASYVVVRISWYSYSYD